MKCKFISMPRSMKSQRDASASVSYLAKIIVIVYSISLKPGMTSVLKNLTSALNKFGHGDRMNAPRVLKLIEPTGLSIAVSVGLSERSECVDALFKLLGSDAFRKDEEISLAIGEALALFAEAYTILETDSSSTINTEDWPLDMDEKFGRSLPPPVQVSFVMTISKK